MAKRPVSRDPADAPKPARTRKPKATASVAANVDSAADNPSAIASENPAPDRILAGTPEFSAVAPLAEAARPLPTADDIRERAYHRYLARGGSQGNELDDWLEAERELRGE